MNEKSDKPALPAKTADKSGATTSGGHRNRMRQRVLKMGANTLTELELLEMLLYAGNPRGDTKPLAKSLMTRFRSLPAILRAKTEDLQAIHEMGTAAIVGLKVAEAAALFLSHSAINNQPVLSNWGAVKRHCVNRLAHEKIEIFLMISLDNQNTIVSEDEISRGTIDQTPVYIREVINMALHNSAKSVLLVHNHPSGETNPSAADLAMTEELRKALAIMTITLHDHLIVAGTECVSLKSLGYI